jgi:acetolactate synthase small subunit
VMAEVSGTRETIDSIVAVMRPFGIKEFVRTGIVAMSRGAV